MPTRSCRAVVAWLILACAAGCNNPFGPEYEYEEQVYLSVDGSATVVIDSSLAALAVLHHLPVNPSSSDAVDRDALAAMFGGPGCDDVRVGQPWVRDGRRHVQVRLSVENIASLSGCGPLRWSTYSLVHEEDAIRFVQEVGPPREDANVDGVNWTGGELVAFKLHAPSRIYFHNVKRLEDGANGEAGRGNVLTWEQTLADRRAGKPLRLEVQMGASSILFRTLWLFAGAFTGAIAVLGGLIWWTVRHARRQKAASAAATPRRV